MRTPRILLSALTISALALTACGGGSSDPSTGGDPVDGKTFTMAVATDPGNLDPALTVLSVTRQVDRFLYARLVETQDDGTVVEGLAEKWKADTENATFTLREGITCSDGSPLTASDVAANINFVGDPKNKSPLISVQMTPGTTATADDKARTVTVKSGAPDPFLLLNVGSLPIVCGTGMKDRKLLAKGEAGTGMFEVSEIVPNDHYTLKRREDFAWGPGDWDVDEKGLPDEVVIKVIPNESTAANLLLSGDLSAATIVGPDQERLAAQNLFHADLRAPIGQMFFNQTAGRPTEEEDVRRGLVQALDLDSVGDVLTAGKGEPAEGMVTIAPNPCKGDTVSGNVPESDTAAAEDALDSAGWKVGSDGIRVKDGKKLSLTVLYSTQTGPTVASGAELVQQTWKKAGVDVELKSVDSTGLNEALFSTGDWDVSMGPLTTGLPSWVVPFVSGPTPPQGTNFSHIENSAYDAAVQKASGKPGTEGCDDWQAAETELYKAVDVVSYVDSVVPTFGNGTEFKANDGIDPASIRMYE
ncbi:ABC transporter substrate-binding protein [Solicola gregarius]|uniref:ABC transporter substrate-binding protein n=1 Tax=Solicola gregarius TaxID=2908642 RepID=A0AA46YLG0_9ACTN|nr:ABC transporter substrate-binding protein [Solicola gregarius]UYM06900.1 ABC transporter substrate-binding protein [Solicola gregarius]